MLITCPSCRSLKIVKNGKTHYGKQNHKCKACGRQFVCRADNDTHSKDLFKACLKERLSLRAICRIFGISLTWLQSFARSCWIETPRHLGITQEIVKKIKRLQVFGIQADEMWSFCGRKKNKRWIWVAYDPVHRLVITYSGGRGTKAARKFWNKIPHELKKCFF